MRVHRSLTSLPPEARGGVVAIGNFDGVHRGHRAVLEAARQRARDSGAPFGVLTFEPHPRELLAPQSAPPRLTPLRAKAKLLAEAGADRLFVQRFDRALAAHPPDSFVRAVLADGLGVRDIVVGEDFRFGRGRSGDVASLAELGRRHGFGVHAVAPIADGATVCSSSRIREAIALGDLGTACRLLGHPHRVEGVVVAGDRRGRALGYPTANLRLRRPLPLLPPDGVYAVRAGLSENGRIGWYDAAANLGVSPTFAGTPHRLEVHLFDQDRDLYGRRLCVAFVARLRGEEAFASVDRLVAQMGRDCARARDILARDATVAAPA